MYALEINGLHKIYKTGVKALNGVDLKIKKGDFFALLGANGAGKTTIIGITTGLVNKTGGSVKVFDIDIAKNHSAAKLKIGLVPQEFNFNIFENVLDIVVSQAGYFGVPREIAIQRAEKILKELSLYDKKDQPSRTLSGGMKRRLMIARALVHEPELLILDEPTAGVDVELRRGMWDYLKDLNSKGVTILLTTHYLEEAEQLCENLAIIKQGQIIRQGKVKELLSSVDQKSYVVNVSGIDFMKKLTNYEIVLIDESTIEVHFSGKQTINDFVKALTDEGVVVNDMRFKGNRLEQLFLSLIN